MDVPSLFPYINISPLYEFRHLSARRILFNALKSSFSYLFSISTKPITPISFSSLTI